jgi:two-component system chemotaxis response regulator CheY
MPSGREPRKKVLVVDDSLSIREEVGAALQPAGFEVLQAFDGLDGLNKILAMPDLAVVVADINMPRMSGLEMLTRVKSDRTKAALPIVMLTTEGKPEMIQRAKQAGAKGWMVKPFKPELLVALVCKFAGS